MLTATDKPRRAGQQVKDVIDTLGFKLLRGYRYADLVEALAWRPLGRQLVNRLISPNLLRPFRKKNLIFIHIPKNAGTSIAESVFGYSFGHHTAQFYRTLDPDFFDATTSFAVLRDPIERFVSSYCDIANGGGEMVPLFPHWGRVYGDSIGDMERFIVAHRRVLGQYAKLDYVMRPQGEFVTDAEGAVIVSRIFVLGRHDRELAEFLADHGVASLPQLNRTRKAPIILSASQERFVRELYASDFALIERVSACGSRPD